MYVFALAVRCQSHQSAALIYQVYIAAEMPNLFRHQQKQSRTLNLVCKCDKVNQETWKMIFTLSSTTSYLVLLLEDEIKLFQEN